MVSVRAKCAATTAPAPPENDMDDEDGDDAGHEVAEFVVGKFILYQWQEDDGDGGGVAPVYYCLAKG